MRKVLIALMLCACLLPLTRTQAGIIDITSLADRLDYHPNSTVSITADSAYSDTVRALRCEELLCEVLVDSLADSLHVALLGSIDGINYTNLSTTGYTTITSTGHYAFIFTSASTYYYYTLHIQTHYGTGNFGVRVRFRPAKKF